MHLKSQHSNYEAGITIKHDNRKYELCILGKKPLYFTFEAAISWQKNILIKIYLLENPCVLLGYIP